MKQSIISKYARSPQLCLVFVMLFGMLSFTPNLSAEAGAGDPAKAGPLNLRIAKDDNGNDLITHNTAKLAWDLIGDATNNNDIDIWNADTNAWVTWGDRGNQTIGGLLPETTYRIYITWYTDRPSLEYKSNVLEFTTAPDTSAYPEPPLAAPSHLRTAGITDSSITLQWAGSPGANGYDLYVNGAWKQGIWDGSNTVTFALPADVSVTGAVYKFEVAAQNLPKTSANSNAVTITWGELAAPRDVQAVTATRTAVSLGWAETPGATGYDIYADGELIGSSYENRYAATGLHEGHAYAFKIVAKNALWRSPDSAVTMVIPGADYNIVSYYTLWSASETGRNFKPSEVDVSQLTHLNFAFADLCWRGFGSGAAACKNDNVPLQKDYVFDGEMIVGDPTADLPLFAEWAAIRDANPHLKLLISVGGWSWSNNFSNMAKTEETRRAFANSVVEFLRAYKLDGLDIDWEYPVEGGEDDNAHSPEDRENFVLMAQAVREALDAAGSEDGKYYLQTIAASQGDSFVVNANLADSSRYLDFINIMTYDYSGSWEPFAHHNSPLYYDKNHPKDYAPRNNTLGGVMGELNGVVPHYKVQIGVPFYGKGWVGCPADGEYQNCESSAPFGTWENGAFDFTDIEENYLNHDGYVKHWNEASKAASLYNPNNGVFLTYNDEASMMYIASLVQSLDLPGVMSWEISGDRNRTLTARLAKDLPINGHPNVAALAAPTGLQAVSVGTETIEVKWNASARATAYEVYIGKVLAGTTSDTRFVLTGLAADAAYNIEVLAVEKEGSTLRNVSVFSSALAVKTNMTPTAPSGPSGFIIQPPAVKEGLETHSVKVGDRLVVSLPTDAALKSIAASASPVFPVIVDGEAKQVDVAVTKEVLAAIAAKGDSAALIIRWNSISFEVPANSLPADADIRILIGEPDQKVLDAWKKLLEQGGYSSIVAPMAFKIERKKADGSYIEIEDFGGSFLSHAFKLKALGIDQAHAAGVVYVPGANELRPVPLLFAANGDGTVTAELSRQGNSVYGIVKTNVSFSDSVADWAKKDVELAASRLIVQANSNGLFEGLHELTRAEAATLIVRALGILPEAEASGSAFKDVANGSEHAADIAAAKNAGLVNGKGDGSFDPNAAVTREQFAVILAKALAYAGKVKTADAAALDHFADKGAVSAYAQSSVALLVEQGIMKGVSANKLAPQSNVTKAQATVLAVKLLQSAELLN
ncbi:glycosyl hydrolase family 18 protein [Paenibacillus sp. MMS18-CY102]|uniref:glycosyl hydrolase family 18 protein n=1 Tax=Paenibacillus sp. MMS18-CY102 TaxID=2682849 RepID=UPI001365D553|nr:glycosyl hydrolase family 18 protein [Paenibacillus sp. MMS18-CY102]MWC31153.1 glycoside hydrolase [Paenibacillus sp. MMS18-CY102]